MNKSQGYNKEPGEIDDNSQFSENNQSGWYANSNSTLNNWATESWTTEVAPPITNNVASTQGFAGMNAMGGRWSDTRANPAMKRHNYTHNAPPHVLNPRKRRGVPYRRK